MNLSFFSSYHFYWILLAGINLAIQIAFFYNDESNPLFIAKKLTTPLLLFFALFIVVIETQGFPLVPCLILTAMGIGEFGMEGSNVVQTKMDTETESPEASAESVEKDHRQYIVEIITDLLDKGATYGQIAKHLQSKGVATLTGRGNWRPQTVSRLYQQTL